MKVENKVTLIQVGVLIMIIAIIVTVFVLFTFIPQQEEIHHLQSTIDDNQNVSSDYRQGWNDCIQELIHYRKQSTNITADGLK